MSDRPLDRRELRDLFRGSFEDPSYYDSDEESSESSSSFEDFRTNGRWADDNDNNNNDLDTHPSFFKKSKLESFGAKVSSSPPSPPPKDYLMMRQKQWKEGGDFYPKKEQPLRPDGKMEKVHNWPKVKWGPDWQEQRMKRLQAFMEHPLYRFAENLTNRISKAQLPSLSKSFVTNEVELERTLQQLVYRQKLNESNPKTIIDSIEQIRKDIKSFKEKRKGFKEKEENAMYLLGNFKKVIDEFKNNIKFYLVLYLLRPTNSFKDASVTQEIPKAYAGQFQEVLKKIFSTTTEEIGESIRIKKRISWDLYKLLSFLSGKSFMAFEDVDIDQLGQILLDLTSDERKAIENERKNIRTDKFVSTQSFLENLSEMTGVVHKSLKFLYNSDIIVFNQSIPLLEDKLSDIKKKLSETDKPKLSVNNYGPIVDEVIQVILRYLLDERFITGKISEKKIKQFFEANPRKVLLKDGMLPVLLDSSINFFEKKKGETSDTEDDLKKLRSLLEERREKALKGTIDLSFDIERKDVMDFSSATNWLNTGIIPLVDVQGHIQSAESFLKKKFEKELRGKRAYWLMTNDDTCEYFAALVAYYINKADIEHGKTYHHVKAKDEARKEFFSLINVFKLIFGKNNVRRY